MKTEQIFILFLIFTFLCSNIAYPLSPSSQIGGLSYEYERSLLGKTKVLVNGAGVIGKRLASVLKTIGFDVYVSDPVRERAVECAREFNCKAIDVSRLDTVRFNLIIDASPAGSGIRNWDRIYSRLSYNPRIIFQGGEDRDISPGIRIESCNISAMGVLFGPILKQFNGIEIEDYYDRSVDESIEGLTEYEPYNHGAQFEEAYPEFRDRVTRFNSYRRNGSIAGYHIHKAIIKGEGLTKDIVKRLIQTSSDNYRILVLDEFRIGDLTAEDMQETPVLIVKIVDDIDGAVRIEYAVPHRVNIVPDNVISIFRALGISNSILLKRYIEDIDRQKKEIEGLIYNREVTLDEVIRQLQNIIPLESPVYGPEVIEDSRNKFIASGSGHVTNEQFLILCQNLRFIMNSLTEGDLVMDGIESQGDIMSFKLGGCVRLTLDIVNRKLLKQEGLRYLPVPAYYGRTARDKYEREKEGVNMDGEANMGLDVFLSWQNLIEGKHSELEKIYDSIFLLKYRDPELSGMDTVQFFEAQTETRDDIDIPQRRFIQPDFISSMHPDNIQARLNRWYYGITGASAFGMVNRKKSLDEEIARTSAKEFFNRLIRLEELGRIPDKIVIQEWGVGDGFSMGIFLDEINRLSQGHEGINFYERVVYIAGDFSKSVLEDLRDSIYYNLHKKRIVLRQLDVLNPPGDLPKALLIRTNYLLNSLPKILAEKKGDGFYEVYRRAYLDLDEAETIIGEDGSSYTFNEVKGILERDALDSVRRIGNGLFKYIKWIEKLVQIENPLYLEYLRGLDIKDGKRVSLDLGGLECVKNMSGLLEESGYIEICDAGAISSTEVGKITGREARFFGAVYSPVNFDFLGNMLDVEMDAMSQGDFVYTRQGEQPQRILLSSVCNVLGDFDKFREYFRDNFNYSTNNPIAKPRDVLRRITEMVMERHGYSEEGLREFEKILRTCNGQYYQFVLKKEQEFVPYRKTKDYVDDYLYSAYFDIMSKKDEMLKKQMWLTLHSWGEIVGETGEYPERNDLFSFQHLLMYWYLFDGIHEGIFRDSKIFSPGLVYVNIKPSPKGRAKRITHELDAAEEGRAMLLQSV